MRPSPELCGNVVLGFVGAVISASVGAFDVCAVFAFATWVAVLAGQAAGELP